jgi:hypothetical protein
MPTLTSTVYVCGRSYDGQILHMFSARVGVLKVGLLLHFSQRGERHPGPHYRPYGSLISPLSLHRLSSAFESSLSDIGDKTRWQWWVRCYTFSRFPEGKLHEEPVPCTCTALYVRVQHVPSVVASLSPSGFQK